MGQRVMAASKVKLKKERSRSESESEKGGKFVVVDPKLGDLSMTRVKRW
jgi:hypothetical protein